MLTSKKIAAYSKIVAGLPDVPSPALSALQLKQWFDTAPEEMRVAFNALIDNLLSTATGDSGAESIGIEPIVGVSAANVQNALEQLKLLINDAVAGAIPDGSIGVAKLSFDPATQVELDAHVSDFTTHVEYALATGTANTYAVTLTPAPTSYVRGMGVSVEINALNTGASTININGLGAKPIKKPNGNDVAAGNLKVGIIYTLRYNGTNFILQGEGGGGNAIAAHLLAGETATVDAGDIVGTMVRRTGAEFPGYERAAAIMGTGGRLHFYAPPGAYIDTTGDSPGRFGVFSDDPDYIAANILAGKDIFGLIGTLASGKAFASGLTPTVFSGGVSTLTITGLAFRPVYFMAFQNLTDYTNAASGNVFGVGYDNAGTGVAATGKGGAPGNSRAFVSSVTASGFTLSFVGSETITGNQSLYWFAFGA